MLARIWRWFSPILIRNLITLVILTIIVSVTAYSLDNANWVRNDTPIIEGLITSIIFGWLISISRFRGLTALFYAVFIAVVIAVEGLANVIPTPVMFFGASFYDLLYQMNLRAWEFYLRATGWIQTLHAGQNIRDSGIFVLILSFILALCGIWLMWTMIRQRKVINGLLPLALLLAINVNLSQQSIDNYMVFLFSALLLIVRTSFNRQHEEWNAHRVDYPEQLGVEWGLSALVLVTVIMMIARAAPLIGTPEGWRTLSDWYDKTQEKTSDTATRLFSGVNPPALQPTKKPVIYVNTPNMGDIGQPVAEGSDTIMYVSISDPPPAPPEVSDNVSYLVTRIHYWRNGIYGAYTGRGWEPVLMSSSPVEQVEKLPGKAPEGRYYLRQHFEIDAVNRGPMFSVSDPVQTSPNVNLRSVFSDPSHILGGNPSAYDVVSAATQVTANKLAESSTDYPAPIRGAYLQLPDELPQRVRTLAMRVTSGMNDPYHKALALQTYLRNNFPYDLSAQPAPANRDVVDYFLFDSTRGFCTHYASAMAVMLRSVGVPARVVTGYAMGDWDERKKAFRVSVSAAHAWVEVYFNGYGWVEFEPTAYRSPITYPEDNSRQQASTVPLSIDRNKNKTLSPTFIVLVALGALALLVLPFMMLRMFFAPRQSPVKQANALYRNMRQALSWAGLPALASITPDEYLHLYSGHLAEYKSLRSALMQATAVYRETVYSPHPPDAGRVKVASQLWQQSLGDWFMLWSRSIWRRLHKQKSD